MVDDLFRDDQGYQSVIPPLVSQATAQQQQQAATYSPHQFPNSWSSYLSGAQATQAEEREPLSKTGSHGSGSSDTTPAPRQSQEAKQQRIREKNRRAMKKFRERQKEKSKDTETKMQDLSKQLQSLQLENERLQSQNRTLKLATLCQKAVSSQPESVRPALHALCCILETQFKYGRFKGCRVCMNIHRIGHIAYLGDRCAALLSNGASSNHKKRALHCVPLHGVALC